VLLAVAMAIWREWSVTPNVGRPYG
jgi:hypothetical protein